MWKIKSFIISVLFIIAISLNSQNTFNKDFKIMNFINQAGSVITYGDTILCIGNGVDTYSYYFYAAFMAKIDNEGNFIKRYVDTDGDYTYQDVNMSYIYKNKLLTAVDVTKWDSTGGKWEKLFTGGYLMITDIASGKIEKKIKFSTPQGDKKWQLLDGFVQIDSVTYAVLSNIDEIDNKHLDSQISIINIKTEKVKYIQFGKEKINDSPFKIVWNGTKLLVGSHYSYPDYDPANPWGKITYHTLIYEVDTSGEVREAFVSDTMREAASEMLIDKDGNCIYISSFVKYYIEDWIGTDRYYKRRHYSINKLDKDFNLVWEKPCGLKYDLTGYNGKTGKVILSSEGDSYIVAVSQANYPWNITWEGRDSMRKTGLSPMIVGVLSKFTTAGDALWTRSYSVVNDTSVGRIEHIIKDITYAPDRGYLIYGDVTNIRKNGDTFALNHAWLFKVDDYGCLVPGCQEGDSTVTEDLGQDVGVKLYPNPVSDRLYIYQTGEDTKHYTIYDISGKKINEWSGRLNNNTYIVDVSKYHKGIYVLTLETADGKQSSRKFVVE